MYNRFLEDLYPEIIYGITIVAFLVPYPLLWLIRALTTVRMMLLLFALDTVLTLEAAYYSSIVFIAVLHIVTIPALFGLVAFDLIQQHRTQFRCLLCGRTIRVDEEFELVKRMIKGRTASFAVHKYCVGPKDWEKKPISKRILRGGIPR